MMSNETRETERVDALRQIKALLPKVYDGMHLVDCPYVDLLLRIQKIVDQHV